MNDLSQGDDTMGQIGSINKEELNCLQKRIKIESEFWDQVQRDEKLDPIIVTHKAERASLRTQIISMKKEHARLCKVLREQRSEERHLKGIQQEAKSMMAVKETAPTCSPRTVE